MQVFCANQFALCLKTGTCTGELFLYFFKFSLDKHVYHVYLVNKIIVDVKEKNKKGG